MRIKDLCESERPRERLLAQGAGSLGNGELLAVLLGSGSREESALELSQRLLNLGEGRLGELFRLSAAKMMKEVNGIGPCKAATILAAFELGKRFLQEESSATRGPLVTARMVYDLMLPQLKGLDHEECWLLFLNSGNYLTGKEKATSGGSRSTVMDIRLAIRMALDRGASGIILVHNHPNGNPRPSEADIKQTDSLHKAANACGIELLDHVIISDGGFFSFADDKVCR